MENKKKFKLFGIFNILDIIIVIAIVAAGFLGFKLIKSNSNNILFAGTGDQQIEYTVGAQKVTLDAINLIKVGDTVYKSENSQYLGIVTDIKYEEHTSIEYNQTTGEYMEYTFPELYNVNITIKGNGVQDDRDVVVEGLTIKIGTALNVKGKGYVFSGYVISLNI